MRSRCLRRELRLPRSREDVVGLGGEADERLTRALARAEGGEDVGRRLEDDLGHAAVLLDLVVDGSLRPEVGHGGRHHHDVGRRGPSQHGLLPSRPRSRPRRPRLPRAPAASVVVTSGDLRRRAPPPRRPGRGPACPTSGCAMNRTGSIGSRVPPAVTSTCSPARSCGASSRSTAATMSSGSARRPTPTSPPASRPDSGSTMCTPRRAQRREVLLHRRVLPHLGVHRRAHDHRRARREQRSRSSRSSEMPAAYAAEEPGGGRGDTTRSAAWPSRVCGIGSPSSHSDVCAGSEASAENVVSPTKRCGVVGHDRDDVGPGSTRRRHTSTAL